MRAVLYI
jgi:NAD(P)-dependent dehydrogenase (short-subunit alcohol dehydrogenase family)